MLLKDILIVEDLNAILMHFLLICTLVNMLLCLFAFKLKWDDLHNNVFLCQLSKSQINMKIVRSTGS